MLPRHPCGPQAYNAPWQGNLTAQFWAFDQKDADAEERNQLYSDHVDDRKDFEDFSRSESGMKTMEKELPITQKDGRK